MDAVPTRTDPGTIVLRPGMLALDWLTLNMRKPDGADTRMLPWEQLVPVKWVDRENAAGLLVGETVFFTQPTALNPAPFSRLAYINDDKGQKMATVTWAPYNFKIHDRLWIQVQFSNEALYTGVWWVLANMFLSIGCVHDSISRVDIAADGIAGHGGDWPQLLQMEQDGTAKYYGKADSITRRSRGKVIGGEFGSRASNKFVRAYGKKREMKSKGHKPHITAAWERAFGFDAWAHPDVEVNRFEIQLRGKEVRRYFPEERNASWMLGLGRTDRQASMMASTAPGLFDYRTPAGRARDAVPVCVWDFSAVDGEGMDIRNRAERNLALSDHTLKVGLRSMYMVAWAMADVPGMERVEMVAQCSGPRFLEWFHRKRMEWVKEFGKLAAAGDANTLRIFHALGEAGGSVE